MHVKLSFILLFLLVCLGSCLKSSYEVYVLYQRGSAITLHANGFADVEYSVGGPHVKGTTKLNLTVENLPEGMAYTIISSKFNSTNDEMEYVVRFSAGSAKGGQYALRVVATGEEGGRAERILGVTISPYTRNDFIKMKRAFDTLYNTVGAPESYMEYQVNVTPDFTNEPAGILFNQLCMVVDMQQGYLFDMVQAEIDTISGKVTLFENDMLSRKLTSGEGYIKSKDGIPYVEINYISTNTTTNNSQNGKIILRP